MTLAWREYEVSTEADYSDVTSSARQYAEEQGQGQNAGATNSGEGGPGTGTGAWVNVQASYYASPGEGSFKGLQSPGYHYAELGTAHANAATGHGYLAKALGLTVAEVGGGFKIQIQFNGKNSVRDLRGPRRRLRGIRTARSTSTSPQGS